MEWKGNTCIEKLGTCREDGPIVADVQHVEIVSVRIGDPRRNVCQVLPHKGSLRQKSCDIKKAQTNQVCGFRTYLKELPATWTRLYEAPLKWTAK